MFKIICVGLLISVSAMGEENKKSAKETINQGADNIDRETRKIIKKGKEVWNDKMEPKKPNSSSPDKKD